MFRSDQPKPTGEWTEGKVFAYFESEDFAGLAKAINAALAAEREKVKSVAKELELAMEAMIENKQLREQLAEAYEKGKQDERQRILDLER